jgi:UDP-glucose 4-epimerase
LKLLVTGGAGYIGSVATALLLGAGHEAVVFDNLSTGSESVVPQGARLVQGDLLDVNGLRSVLAAGFEGVLHFAARSVVGESVEHPERYYRTNVCGTLNLLGIRRYSWFLARG